MGIFTFQPERPITDVLHVELSSANPCGFSITYAGEGPGGTALAIDYEAEHPREAVEIVAKLNYIRMHGEYRNEA